MARSTMVDLIARLRVLVGDPSGSHQFTDDQLQDFLDDRRTDVNEAQLRYGPTTTATSLMFVDFTAPHGSWEDSVVLSGAAGNALNPDTEDLIRGRWTFTAGTAIPVYITGSFFDLYGAAQAVLEAWAATVAREFDFTTDQQTFDRTGKREGLLAVAREFARKARQPGRAPAWRSSEW